MSRCWKETGQNPIKTGWADTNKGTSECPNMRSRRVAKEYHTGLRPDLFSARRAYFYAKARHRVYIELLERDGRRTRQSAVRDSEKELVWHP